VLVDEASMLDVQLMAALLRALPEGCQVVLVSACCVRLRACMRLLSADEC